jgi:hypothetical protein
MGGSTTILRNITGLVVNVPVCPNASVTINSNVTGTTYQWQQNTGSGFVNLSDNSTITGSNTASLQLSNVPQSWNGYQYKCLVSGNQESTVFSLTVSGTPVTPSVTIATPLTSICAGANVTFTATPVNGGTIPSYQWQVNGVNAGTNSPTYSVNNLQNGVPVKVIMTSNATCAVPANVTSNVITMTVGTVVTPSVSVTYAPSPICAGSSVTFTATPVNGGTTPVYEWKKMQAVVGTNSPTYTDNTLAAGDIVTVKMTSNAGCVSTASAISPAVNIAITPSVTPDVTINGNTAVTQGEITTISAVVVNGGTTPVYQWQDSTATHTWQSINGATGVSIDYEPMASGDKLRCRVTSTASCPVPASVNSNVLEFAVASGLVNSGFVTPNPVSGTLNIDNLRIADGWQTLEITDINGVVKSRMNSGIANQTRISMDVSGLASGYYIAVLRKQDGTPMHLRFIKM